MRETCYKDYSVHNGRAVDCAAYYAEYAASMDVSSNNDILERCVHTIQRLIDILVGALGLCLSLPLFAIFSLLIKFEDGGPILYKQERVGLRGRHFTMYKLRSMRVNAENGRAQWATKNDPRVTKVGEIIRKIRIDELPQFYNILLGDMRLVGPRPERPEFVVEFNDECPGFVARLQVKPGVTGWAQVNGGYDISPTRKLELDLYYIENRSILLDLNVLFRSIYVLLTGNGAR